MSDEPVRVPIGSPTDENALHEALALANRRHAVAFSEVLAARDAARKAQGDAAILAGKEALARAEEAFDAATRALAVAADALHRHRTAAEQARAAWRTRD